MNERPILFSSAMIKAIIEGRKTQTRRVIKQADMHMGMDIAPYWADAVYPARERGFIAWQGIVEPGPTLAAETKRLYKEGFLCPYGVPGDRLWVRESHFRFGHWEPIPGVKTKTGRVKWRFVEDAREVRYADNPPADFRRGMHHKDPATPAWHKRPSQFMFHKHSRIMLEVTEVRAEQVQAISEHDAKAEGVATYLPPVPFPANWPQNADGKYTPSYGMEYASDRSDFATSACGAFAQLWDSINLKRGYGWAVNPWVWVVGFAQIART